MWNTQLKEKKKKKKKGEEKIGMRSQYLTCNINGTSR